MIHDFQSTCWHTPNMDSLHTADAGHRQASTRESCEAILPGTVCLLLLIHLIAATNTVAQTPRLAAEQQKNFGVAYLEENLPEDASHAFRRVIELVPGEALGYADLGIALLRLGQLEAAASQLEQARRVDPANIDVLLLGAEVQYSMGDWKSVVSVCRKALELDPRHPMARFYVYRAAVADAEDTTSHRLADAEIAKLFDTCPDNLVVAILFARTLASQGQPEKLQRAIQLIRTAVEDSDHAQGVASQIERAREAGNDAEMRHGLTALENMLRPTSRFRQDLFQLQPPVAGLPITRFSSAFYEGLVRQRPRAIDIHFRPTSGNQLAAQPGSSTDATAGSLDFADIDGDGREDILVAISDGTRGQIQLWSSLTGTWTAPLSDREAVPVSQARFVDLANVDRFDIVAVGPAGLLVARRADDGRWTNATAGSGLGSAAGVAVELIDADNEGDLDLCVAGIARSQLWQNRSDGTFRDMSDRSGFSGAGPEVQQVVATDHDDDVDTDLVVVDSAGRLHLWDNRRHGRFVEQACGLTDIACRSVLPRDFDNDGYEDLMLVCRDGKLRFQRNAQAHYQTPLEISVPDFSLEYIIDLDFDNDGWLDLAAVGNREGTHFLCVARNQADGNWCVQNVGEIAGGGLALGSVDLDWDGDCDLLALDGRGRLHVWDNEGGNANHWMRVQLRGLRIAGSKNNLHGIGSQVELKAGPFYEMKFVRRPTVHFGLGDRTQADLLRVVWSNGVPQNRLHPTADQTIREPQILKGSCPYLYCWDGTEFTFVTDTLAAAPLGLQVAEGVIAPDNPRELLTIPRQKIAPLDDAYVFQYTSELWETVYLDEVSLWLVDRPAGIDVFTDQRFLPPPYEAPAPIFTRGRIPPVHVEDSADRDVTSRLLLFDHQYPERLKPTRYQGVVQPHALTLHFGDVQVLQHPLLVLGCWIFWTDTSINVAMSQSPSAAPGPATIEVWHPERGWRPLDIPLGLPCGKDKWIVLDLSTELSPSDARVRIRSESQIYWDQAFLADRVDVAHCLTRLAPRAADLHQGGFNRLYRPTEDGPHLYRYGRQARFPVWMDMHGMATRYGDVTELLTASDDRFVIFTGGDEVTLRFAASGQPPLRAGWERDFLFYSDGWEKDSDRNTVTGETVLPLPFHAMSSYPYGTHESYPVDPLHRDYLDRYNTRLIGPDAFRAFVKEFKIDDHRRALSPLPWATERAVRGDRSP